MKFIQNSAIIYVKEVKLVRNKSIDHEYGVLWNDVFVEKRERYKTAITDFHEHDFFEINLIVSGNIKAVVENMTVEGTQPKIVLTRPKSSHFLTCKSDVLYSSIYLVFTEDFIKTYDVDFTKIMSVFGEKGAIYTLSVDQAETFSEIINEIDMEENPMRKKLLMLYLFSRIGDVSQSQSEQMQNMPIYIYKALNYIDAHYNERITAVNIAKAVHVGRTTLMTEFKRHTGNTLHEYVTNCRLRNSIKLLYDGKTEYEAAISSGFSDASALIQCFKRTFEMTPRQYIKNFRNDK